MLIKIFLLFYLFSIQASDLISIATIEKVISLYPDKLFTYKFYPSDYRFMANITYFNEIRFSGFVLNHPFLTPDILTIITCHEIGHAMGKVKGKNAQFILSDHAVEGEADYYAANTCLKKVWGKDSIDELESSLKNRVIHPYVDEMCSMVYPHSKREALICKRSIVGGMDLFKIYLENPNDLVDENYIFDLNESTEQLIEVHPKNNCRLESIFNGALNFERPKCWYKKMDIDKIKKGY